MCFNSLLYFIYIILTRGVLFLGNNQHKLHFIYSISCSILLTTICIKIFHLEVLHYHKKHPLYCTSVSCFPTCGVL